MKIQGLVVTAGLGTSLAKFVDELYAGTDSIHCAPSEMAQNVEGKAPGINACFGNTVSLYNTTLNDVCSDKCQENVVKASFYVKKQCNIVKPTEAAPIWKNRHLVYNVWADFTATEVVCKKDIELKIYCLAHFTNAAVALATNEVVNVPVDHARLCSGCNKGIYMRFKAEPFGIPMVSSQVVFRPDLVMRKLSEICKW